MEEERRYSDATALYRGPGGESYWQRNAAGVQAASAVRRQALRALVPGHARFTHWLEFGAGLGANLCYGDVGVDLDLRVLRQMRAGVVPVLWDVTLCSLPFFPERSFPVVLSVGLLMHLPAPTARRVIGEMTRLSSAYLITGEYDAAEERDLRWNPETGAQGDGPPGLLWERPYAELMDNVGLELLSSRADLPGFEARVTFAVWRRKNSDCG